MAFIRTNLQAGIIARHLAGINRSFTTNLERLSTGLRLNRPDDSPGQFGVVINQRLQLSSLSQGVINAQNAAGMLQTAEEGIASLIDVLNRAHDLAVTAADSTLTEAQRQQAQDEVEELITKSSDSEIDLILKNVKFNGVQLLSESNQAAAIENSTLGLVGGNREATTVTGGVSVDVGSSGAFSAATDLAANAIGDFLAVGNGTGTIDGQATAVQGNLNLLTIDLANATTFANFKVGDFLQITATDTSDTAGTVVDTFVDSVVVVNTDPGNNEIAVANARSSLTKLDSETFLTTTYNTATQADTVAITRIAQTLLVDSTGATTTTSSSSGKTFDFRSGQAAEFRNRMSIGVVLNPSNDDDKDSANLGTVIFSFSESDPIAAASQIEAALESQLGGEHRSGGELHIDVTAVAEVRKATVTSATGTNFITNSISLGVQELTTTLINSSQTLLGANGTFTATATTAAGQYTVLDEFADIQNVRYKFTTTTTAGINKTPQLRVISQAVVGAPTGTIEMFENLEIATGRHGNDKFILTVDGEEVEVDIDVKKGNDTSDPKSANGIIQKVFDTEEAARTTSALALTMVLAPVGFDIDETTGELVSAGTIGATASSVNDLSYFTDDLDAGYFDPEGVRVLLQDAINDATRFATDVTTSYDSTTRTITNTTGSRGNTSSLLIGKSFAVNNTSTNVATVTDLVNTTDGTSSVGALGFNEESSSKGSGSFFTYRLGGNDDIFSIEIDTLGASNFGADDINIFNINVATQGGAAAAISLIEQALESVSTTQTKIGAGINHMQRRINVLETHREALSGQKARIEEIDFTQETRTLASLQILLQSSTAALAQANIIPQTLLQLLA